MPQEHEPTSLASQKEADIRANELAELSEAELENAAGGVNIACGSGPVNAYKCGKAVQ
jgi:hypothetical protein